MTMFGVSSLHLVVALTVTLFVYVVQKWIRVRRFYKDLPKPPHSFLLGHLPLFAQTVSRFPPRTASQYIYTEIATRYSLPAIWYLDLWPFAPPQIILTSTEAAYQVTTATMYPGHAYIDKLLRAMFGPGTISGSNGATWKYLHHLMGPGLSPRVTKLRVPIIAEQALIFHNQLCRIATSANAIAELNNLLPPLLIDISSHIILGFPFGAQQGNLEMLNDLEPIMDVGQDYLSTSNPFLKMRLWWKMRGPRLRTDSVLRPIVEKRYAQLWEQMENLSPKGDLNERGKGGRSILDGLLVHHVQARKGKKGGENMDRGFLNMVTANVKALLSGGQGTTSDTLCYILLLISLHPDVLEKLRNEHDRVFGPGLDETIALLNTTPSKTSELEYTNAVIKETLRLFPVGYNPLGVPPGVSTLTINGKSYPVKDQMVLPLVHTTHYNPEYFPEPSKFLPDRFLDSYEPKVDRYAWRPFERGPRTCMGQELAMEDMRVVLLFTVRWFDFEPIITNKAEKPRASFSDWDTKIGDMAFQVTKFTAAPRGPVPMKVRLRGR